MSHIAHTFASLRAQHRTALMPYFPIGYPDLPTTVALVTAAIEAGADLIELGIPFSDPLADGATIQRATWHALQQGVTIGRCLEVVATIRRQGIQAPLILMSYYNPILQCGPLRFCARAKEAGADGLIVPDLPPEEASELQEASRAHGLDLIFLLAPTSTPERIRLVAERASGFIYLVSLTGVTGARDRLPPDLEAFVARVRAATTQPLAVGFGIANAEQARRVAAIADGVIIGSALVKLAGESPQPVTDVQHFLEEIRSSLYTARPVVV